MNNATTSCTYGREEYWNTTDNKIEPIKSGAATGVNFQFSTSTCLTISNASSSPTVSNGFTQGEMVAGFFLLLILVLQFFTLVLERTIGVKVQKTDNFV